MENGSLENETSAVTTTLAERLRTGSLAFAAIVLLHATIDLPRRPGGAGATIWLYALALAVAATVHLALRDTRLRARAAVVGAAAVVSWNFLLCLYAVMSPSSTGALLAVSTALVTAAAFLLPWGMRVQTTVAIVCVMTYVVALASAAATPEPGTLYALASLIVAAAASCAGAYASERQARLASRLIAENRTAREAGVKKDEFLASVSHELRTPLNVVLGYIDLLLDHSFGPLEPAQRDILHRITKNASNLSHLINDLIDLSRIEAGRLKIELHAVDVAPLFGDMRSLMDMLLAGHDVAFHAELAPGCTPVRADAERLKQIVSNLLVNAVKFTETGSITLRADPCGDAVAISVTDTGIGIPPAAHSAIFEPFRQVHDRSRRVPGAGIGLSISSRLAQLMGGSLAVESEPGRGSRFTLTVPAAAAPALELVAAPLRLVG